MKGLVSVCIPLFNGELFLEECLQSIIDQSYQEIEILVVDDKSCDSSLEIVKKFQAKDFRIRLIVNDTNLGLVGNWNKCIDQAKGEWIKFQFQDDLMLPQTVEEMRAFAEAEKLNVVLTDRLYLKEGNEIHKNTKSHLSNIIKVKRPILPSELTSVFVKHGFSCNFLGEPIVGICHKSIFSRYGNYDTTLNHIVDMEFWLRIGLNEPIGFIPEYLHQFRVHDMSQSAKNNPKGEVGVGAIDIVKILSKLKSNKNYLNFRKIMIGKDVEEFHQRVLSALVISNGYNRLKKVIGEDAELSNLPLWLKGAGKLKDYYWWFFNKFQISKV